MGDIKESACLQAVCIVCTQRPLCFTLMPFLCCFQAVLDSEFVLFSLQCVYKKAAAFVLRAVGKHSPQLAQATVDCGALDSLVICLEDFDPGVKEAAAWALAYIARHNAGTGVCLKIG